MYETDLYKPIKTYFERLGYGVKSEIKNCDVVAIKDNEPPIIVELKLRFSLSLLMQGIDRQLMTDSVYVAYPIQKGKRSRSLLKDSIKICRRLSLGLITVRLEPTEFVKVHCEPVIIEDRKNTKRSKQLLDDYYQILGDPNLGGQSRKTIMTAYRQDAIYIADAIIRGENGKPYILAKSLGISNSRSILYKNYYGWFYNIERGVYGVTDKGQEELKKYKSGYF
jgi:hypothetical protein